MKEFLLDLKFLKTNNIEEFLVKNLKDFKSFQHKAEKQAETVIKN